MLQQRNRTIQVSGLPESVSGYLQRMDVFPGVSLINSKTRQGRHDRRDSLMELTRLDKRSQIDRTANQIANALVGKMPDIDPGEPRDEMSCRNKADYITIPISYALAELLNNALSHARLKGYTDARVWIASQYYPQKGRLQLAVVDNGCGIFETLKEHSELSKYQHKTDLEAILAALHPRVSCNRDLGIYEDSENAGIGLTTTSRIADHANGHLAIISGTGFHHPKKCSRQLTNNVRWQGVAIALECKRDALLNVRIPELLPPREEKMPHIELRFEE